ncbi:hypothetical protein EV127DRAFT_446363 [Xylaria flabelliformis]|nr:hypothetical protein EV127DRAFT_446363 [Xylaria flabelliformis]
MKPCLSSRSDSRPFAGGTACDSSGNCRFSSQFGCQSASHLAQPVLPPRDELRTKRTRRILLSIVSATSSLLSALFVGPSIASSAGWNIDHTIELWLSSGRHVMSTSYFSQSDRDTVPSVQRVTAMFHVSCLSTLILYRSRKSDPYQLIIIALITLLGLCPYTFLVSDHSYMDIIGKGISILPCLLSLGAITSASLHSIGPLSYFQRHEFVDPKSWI